MELQNSELRSAAREQLKGNWGTAILLCVIFSIITVTLSFSVRLIPYVGYFVNFCITGPFALGLAACFIKLVRRENFRLENLFDGFNRFSTALVAQLLITLFTFLWTLVFIIPGIIAQYRYSMVFYILNDNQGMSAREALEASKQMMIGYKWKLFCLQFSFIGWALLSVITLFIGYLWLIPYYNTSIANFYQNLKDTTSKKEILI